MKNFVLMIFGFFAIMLSSCSSQTYLDQNTLNQVLENKEFTFMAEKALPTSYDAMRVANSIPNYNSSRMTNLDYGYSIIIKKDELISVLPYFGRMYNPSYNTDKNSLRFTSKDYRIESTDGRKNSKVFVIIPNDVNHIRRMILEVFPTGRAYLSVDANDRQPISYDGYLMKNEVKK